jgi:transmembrane sensor
MMSEPEGPAPTGNPLLEEAASWFARMRGPYAEASRPEFEAWLRRGALHRHAYNRAAEIFAMGKLLAEDDSKDLPPEAPPGESRARRPRLLAAAVGAAALFALALTAWLALGPFPAAVPRQGRGGEIQAPSYAARLAADGQAQTITLPDGSSVTVRENGLLEVLISASERRFRLVRGEARFDVFHEPRPFVVMAGGGQVTARGTLFDVALSTRKGVRVQLIEGVVDVALPRGRGDHSSLRLRAGQSVSFSAGDPGATILPNAVEDNGRTTDASGATGDVRVYQDITVAELIAAANLGSDCPIRLDAREIAGQRVSGRFGLKDNRRLAERLAILFDLVVDAARPHQILLRAR